MAAADEAGGCCKLDPVIDFCTLLKELPGGQPELGNSWSKTQAAIIKDFMFHPSTGHLDLANSLSDTQAAIIADFLEQRAIPLEQKQRAELPPWSNLLNRDACRMTTVCEMDEDTEAPPQPHASTGDAIPWPSKLVSGNTNSNLRKGGFQESKLPGELSDLEGTTSTANDGWSDLGAAAARPEIMQCFKRISDDDWLAATSPPGSLNREAYDPPLLGGLGNCSLGNLRSEQQQQQFHPGFPTKLAVRTCSEPRTRTSRRTARGVPAPLQQVDYNAPPQKGLPPLPRTKKLAVGGLRQSAAGEEVRATTPVRPATAGLSRDINRSPLPPDCHEDASSQSTPVRKKKVYQAAKARPAEDVSMSTRMRLWRLAAHLRRSVSFRVI
jgi:hypothetical protein